MGLKAHASTRVVRWQKDKGLVPIRFALRSG